MMNTKLLLQMTAAAGLVSCIAPVDAHEDRSEFAALTGTFTYQDSITPTKDPNCPIAGMTIGTGTVDQIGKAAVASTACINQNQSIYIILSGSIALVAATGDILTATYTGSFYPTGKGAIYELNDGMLKITGGTGQFAHATGRGTLKSTEDLATGKATSSFSATISYRDRNQESKRD